MEIWKPLDIKAFEGLYFISNRGNFKNMTGEVRKCKTIRNKYVTISLFNNEKRSSFIVKNLVAKHFKSNCANKKTVINKDGNILNNHVDNLRWADLPPVWNKEPEITLYQHIINSIRQNGGRLNLASHIDRYELPFDELPIKEHEGIPVTHNFLIQHLEKEVNYCHCEIAKTLEKLTDK